MHTAPWTNKMGYIAVIARVARNLWQHKQTLSSGYAPRTQFVSHKSLAPCHNYYIDPTWPSHIVEHAIAERYVAMSLGDGGGGVVGGGRGTGVGFW